MSYQPTRRFTIGLNADDYRELKAYATEAERSGSVSSVARKLIMAAIEHSRGHRRMPFGQSAPGGSSEFHEPGSAYRDRSGKAGESVCGSAALPSS